MAEQSNEDVLSVITQIVSEESGVDAEEITPSTTFAQDLDVDSLGLLTIATRSAGGSRGLQEGLTPNDPGGRLSSRRCRRHRPGYR